MKVLKFGGTSVGSAERIIGIKNILKDYFPNEKGLVIVLSAFSGVTDQLLKIAELASMQDIEYENEFENLQLRHHKAISDLLGFNKLEFVTEKFQILSSILKGVFLLREISEKSKDKIVSYGELLSSKIIATYFEKEFENVNFIDSRSCIKTDHNFVNANVLFEETNNAIKENYNKNAINVMGGFIASNLENETTTLGRGGSDYTAAIVAAALNAEELLIYTDVSGVLTADPKKVKKAFALKQISYEEAMEMSHFGAKVIYPPTIQPIYKKNIPIRIKNTLKPNDEGTLINNEATTGKLVKGITSISNISLIRLEGTGMIGVAGISARLFNALAQKNISIVLISQASSEQSICIAVNEKNGAAAQTIINQTFEKEIEKENIKSAILENEVSILAIVGSQMNSYVGLSGRLFSILGKNGINIKAIAQGSSEINISLVIDRNVVQKALNVIHDGMFLSDLKSLNVFVVGTGLIGKTLLNQIKNQSAYLIKEKFLDLKLIGATNTRKCFINEDGIELNNWENILNEKGSEPSLDKFVEAMIAMNLSNTIFVDNTASETPIPYYEKILANSISIVTPNKIAKTQTLAKTAILNELCKKYGVNFCYETNVGAGLPIISTLKDLLQSGDKILKIEAILSGSLSYIFNNFNSNKKFSNIVLEAKNLGFTEPDPRIDLSGKDVARKVLILAREIGMEIELENIEIENILPQKCLDANDVETFMKTLDEENNHFKNLVEKAENENRVLRFMAIIENGKASVKLKAVNQQNPFYNLSGSDNMIVFKTTRYNERPLVIKGPGAGAEVTAAGVFAEIIKIGDLL